MEYKKTRILNMEDKKTRRQENKTNVLCAKGNATSASRTNVSYSRILVFQKLLYSRLLVFSKKITIKQIKIMITLKRYLLTLVALLAMTTGAWAQQTTVTWDSETWADGWTSDVKTHTVDGVTITVGGTADAKKSSGNLFIWVDNSASNTLTFSADIPIARIEMTKKTASSSLDVSPLDGWSVSSDGTTVIWEGTATKSLVCEECTLTVSKIKFFLEESLMTLDDTKTVATMAKMPAYDATVSYELVRDLTSSGTTALTFDGVANTTVKKGQDGKYQPATAFDFKLNAPLITGDDKNIIGAEGITTTVVILKEIDGTGMYTPDETVAPIALADFLADAKPGNYQLSVTASATSAYDGTLKSTRFTLAEGYEVTIPAQEYITYYAKEALTTEENSGAELYTIASVTDKEAVLTRALETAPAETPLLVFNSSTEDKTFLLIPTADPDLALTVAKEFKGTAEGKEFTADYYVCTGKAFVWVKGAGKIGANKCWLEISKTSQPASSRTVSRSIVHGNGTTGITTTDFTDETDGDLYDLNGRKVTEPKKKGIYIKNGKKVVIK